MADLFTNLVTQALGIAPVVEPVLASQFAPELIPGAEATPAQNAALPAGPETTGGAEAPQAFSELTRATRLMPPALVSPDATRTGMPAPLLRPLAQTLVAGRDAVHAQDAEAAHPVGRPSEPADLARPQPPRGHTEAFVARENQPVIEPTLTRKSESPSPNDVSPRPAVSQTKLSATLSTPVLPPIDGSPISAPRDSRAPVAPSRRPIRQPDSTSPASARPPEAIDPMGLDPLPVSRIAASSTDDMALPESQGTHPKTSISTNRRASRAKDMRAKADDIRVDPMEPSPLPSSSPIATSTIIYPATWPESQEADPDQKALANLQAAKTKNLQINATRIGKSPQAVIRPLIEPTLETHQPASFRDEQSAGESEQAPLIRVSIGRIQVLGMPQTPTPTGKRAEAPGPVLSLSEYLAQRRGGTR